MARVVLGAALTLALHGGCRPDRPGRELGAPCVDATDCAELCLPPSAEIPGGFCTLACTTSADCPADAACVARDRDVCLFRCLDDDDCKFLGTDVAGAGWSCVAATAVDGEGVFVCLGA